MDISQPVLTERKDIKMWKNLCNLEVAAAKNSKKNLDKLRRALDEVIHTEGYVSPAIICKMLDLVDIYLYDEMHTHILELLEKCRITDCTPQLKAAEMLISMGLQDSAKIILDRMTVITNHPQWEYLRGLVDRRNGENDSAKEHFIRCVSLDANFLKVYHELEQLDTNGGWRQRRMIASLMQGIDQPFGEGYTGRLWELYNAYWVWKNKDGGIAVDQLKRIVREGIESDVDLALARVYASQKNYQSAIDCFMSAANDKRNEMSALLDMTDMCIAAGRADDALNLCDRMQAMNLSDRRIFERTIRSMAVKKDRSGVKKYSDMLLYNDYADIDAYTVCVTAMIDLSMHSEASGLISKMSSVDSDLPVLYYLSSRNDYMVGRYQSSYSAAQKALRKEPDNREYLLLVSKTLIALGRLKKAQKHLDKILSVSKTDRDALLLKKDLEKSKEEPDYKEAYRLCQLIIANYPDDTETIRDSAAILEKMNRFDDALDAYRSALSVRNDPVLFLGIINTLYHNGRLIDVVKIATENERGYGHMIDTWILKANAEYSLGSYPDAIASYSRAIELDNNNPTLWHSKGMAEEQAHQYADAEVSFDRAVLMDLDNAEYWISKAAVEEGRGDYAAAINSLNRVISLHPENVYSLMRKASILVRLGKLEDAEIFVELASRIDPMNRNIQIAKRDIYFHAGDTENTKNVCNQILKNDPSDLETIKILARTYRTMGMLDDALKILNTSGGNDLETLMMLRELYCLLGKTREEISTCKTALKIDPDNRELKSALADAYIKIGQVEAAKTLYDDLHTDNPDDAEFSIKKAKVSNDDDALTVLRSTLEADPGNLKLLLEISNLLLAMGRYDESMVYIERAISVDKTQLEPHKRKIELIQKCENYEWMLSASRDAVHYVTEKDPILWKYMGYAQMMLGDQSNALISFDTAMKMGMESADLYMWRGMSQEAMGMYEQAMDSYDCVLRGQSDIQALIRSAAVSLRLGKDAQAMKFLDRVLDKDPVNEEALITKARIFAARGNIDAVKKIYDECKAGGASGATAGEITDIWQMMNTGETVVMPIIALGITYVPPVITGGDTDIDEVVLVPEAESERKEVPEDSASDDEIKDEEEISETEDESSDADGIAPETSDETGTDAPETVNPNDDPIAEQDAEVTDTEPAAVPLPEREEKVVPEPPADDVPDDDVDLGFVVMTPSAATGGQDSYSTRQEGISVVHERTSEHDDELVIDEKTIEEYAVDLVGCAYENEDLTEDDELFEAAGIPVDKRDEVYRFLSDFEEYGPISPDSNDFARMEKESHDAIVRGNIRDIEDECLLPMTSAYFDSGVKDIEEAKRLVAYVYEALKCDLESNDFSEAVRLATDEIVDSGRTMELFEIMDRFGLGVYSARAVKEASMDGGSVMIHI